MTRGFSVIMPLAGLLVLAVNGFAVSTPRTCPAGITKDMVINYNDDVSCALDVVGEVDFYRFQGTAGEKINIDMLGDAFNGPCFSLYDPTNTKVQDVCGTGSTVSPSAMFTLAKTGTYTIRAYDLNFDGTFHYRIYLERYFPPLGALPIAYGQTLAGSIGSGEVVDQWVFSGASGDQVGIQVTGNTFNGPCFQLWQPDGTMLNNTLCGTGSVVNPRGEFTLAQTGTHLVRVYDWRIDNAFNYNLFLQCLGTCTVGTLGISTLSIAPTGCTACVNGNIFSARLTVANMPASTTELKLGFYLPDKSQMPVSDPHLELPAGFTFDGEIVRGTINASHQRGDWMLCARIIGLSGGDILAASCQSFTITP